MRATDPATNDRIKAAIAATAIQALLIYALVAGLAVRLPDAVGDSLKLFAVGPPPPPPPIEKTIPRPVHSSKREGAASPPNLRSKATEIVVPPPIIPPPVPPPVIAALKPGIGGDPTAGASDKPGPGTGSGGEGNGTGSGGAGDGDGDGGDETPPRRLKGRIKDSDYPRGAGDAGVSGTVSVRFRVGIDGRASECGITHSSGSTILDDTTCRLIEQRFRYAPSRDADGRPVSSIVVMDNDWVIENAPQP